jgi:excisionase family DNA binding protein
VQIEAHMSRPEITGQKLAFSVSEFCAACGVSRDTFYKLVRDGEGPVCFFIGRRRLISLAAAERWMKKREASQAA